MDAVADLASGDVSHEEFGDRLKRAHELDLVADDIEHAAAFQAFAFLMALEADLHRDRESRTRDVADEVDVKRRIGDRIDLNVTGQHSDHVAVDPEVVKAGEEAPAAKLPFHHVVVERYGEGLAAAAVNDGRRAAFAS